MGNSKPPLEVVPPVSGGSNVGDDAETALLGTIVLCGAWALHDALDLGLRPEHFGNVRGRALFNAAIDLDDKGHAIEVFGLFAELQSTGMFRDVTEIARLDGLSSGRSVRPLVASIVQRSAERATAKVARSMTTTLASDFDRSEWVSMLRGWADDLGSIAAIGDISQSAGVPIDDVLDQVEHEWSEELSGVVRGIDTGFSAWNHVLGRVGPRAPWLVTIAGRPAMGKSTLAQSWTLYSQFHRKGELWTRREDPVPVLWACSEMTKVEIARSFVAAVGRLERRSVESPTHDWMKHSGAQRERAMGLLRGSDITFVDDHQAGILEEIEAIARAWRSRHPRGPGPEGAQGRRKPAMVVVDYLQRLKSRRWRGQNREEEINHLATSLKTLARNLDVVVLMLCQLNRAVESRADKRPMLSDLRESGSIEQESDVVSFVYRDHYYNPKKAPQDGAEIITAKNRKGPLETVHVAFEGKYSRFLDRPAPGEAPVDVDEMWG